MQETWLKELRNKLEAFLFEGLKREGDDDMPEPRLIELYVSFLYLLNYNFLMDIFCKNQELQ